MTSPAITSSPAPASIRSDPVPVTFAPYPSQADPRGTAASLDESLSAVRAALKSGQIGAVLVEPMLGRGGCVVPPVSFLPALRSLADEAGALLPFGQVAFAASAGRLGSAVTLNGQAIPLKLEGRPGSRLRLRLANACNARATRIRFDGVKVYVAAVDGQPADTFEPLKATLPFAPGTRYDLLLDLPTQSGPAGAIMALLGQGLPLANLIVAGDPVTQAGRSPIASIGPRPGILP